jgi:hypothetical protein
MAKIRAIIKRADEECGHVSNISASLKNLQKLVEGPIEVTSVTDDTVIICNEEGKLQHLPFNFTKGTYPFCDTIVGDIVVVGVEGEEFVDCPIDFATWKWLLKSWGN